MTRPIARGALEIDGGDMMTVAAIATAPNREDLLQQTAHAVCRNLKDALWGLGPIFGPETLLKFCAAIIEEDFHPDQPQTRRASDDDGEAE
jgi:hypothetical protein